MTEDIDPFARFLQEGKPQGPWNYRVISGSREVKAASSPSKVKVALHIHAYYPDLFVSVKNETGKEHVMNALQCYKGNVIDIQAVQNCGRDIAPFLSTFGERLVDNYDIVGHLHTKKSVHISDNHFVLMWKNLLMENLLGGEFGGAMADTILTHMVNDPNIGIVFPDDPNAVGWSENYPLAEKIAQQLGFSKLPKAFNFPIGTMFWTRTSVLQRFLDLKLEWKDYPPEPLPIDGSLLHALERLFGVVPSAMGMQCVSTYVPGITRKVM